MMMHNQANNQQDVQSDSDLRQEENKFQIQIPSAIKKFTDSSDSISASNWQREGDKVTLIDKKNLQKEVSAASKSYLNTKVVPKGKWWPSFPVF